MAEVELKRCPFCGGYAHLDDPSEMGDYGVSCENCGLFVMFGRDGECQTREEAADAWNRRNGNVEKTVRRIRGRTEKEG